MQKKRGIRISKKSYDFSNRDMGMVYVYGVSAKKIKATKVISSNEALVTSEVFDKTSILLHRGNGYGHADVLVVIKLKKEVNGKKRYKYTVQVDRYQDESPTLTYNPGRTYAPAPTNSVRPTKTPTIKPLVSPSASYVPGSVTHIKTTSELLTIGGESKKNSVFVLDNDIDMQGVMSSFHDFYAVLDGNGYVIRNVGHTLIERNFGKINNVSIENAKINSIIITRRDGRAEDNWRACSSILTCVNESDGIIQNCKVNGQVSIPDSICEEICIDSEVVGSSNAYFAGISALNDGIIDSCTNNATIFSGYIQCYDRFEEKIEMHCELGGIVGCGDGTINQCVNRGSISSNRNRSTCAGILSGYREGVVAGSDNYGMVTSSYGAFGIASEASSITDYSNNGELIGINVFGIGNANTISNSTNKGKLVIDGVYDQWTTATFAGIGRASTMYRVENKGTIEIKGENAYGGGIALGSGKIEEACNEGDVVVSPNVENYGFGGIVYYGNAYTKNCLNSGSLKNNSTRNSEVINASGGDFCIC